MVGVDGDAREGLLNEDGALETGTAASRSSRSSSSDGRLRHLGRRVDRADAAGRLHPGAGGDLESDSLRVTIFAAGDGRPARLLRSSPATGRATAAPRRAAGTLFLAVRPFQVNPPSQFLNMPGGTRADPGDSRATAA